MLPGGAGSLPGVPYAGLPHSSRMGLGCSLMNRELTAFPRGEPP